MEEEDPIIDPKIEITAANNHEEQMMLKFPRTCSITSLLEMDYLAPISQLLSENSSYDFQNNLASAGNAGHAQMFQFGEMPYQSTTDTAKFQVTQSCPSNQPWFANPVYNLNGLDRN